MFIRYVTLDTNYKKRFGYLVSFLYSLGFFVAFSAVHATASQDQIRLVAFGDSLTAGYGLQSTDSFSNQLQNSLQKKGYNVIVINSGVSGDTTAGGLARLDWALGDNIDGVIMELGANDALRGVPPASTRASLEQMLVRLKQRNLDTLLTGMLAPPNLGPDYGKNFNAIFPDLALKYNLVFYPFFLKNVAGIPSLNQADGLHPTAQGVKIIVQNILPKVEELLEKITRRRQS
jgi:acyl-CoA thioesterase I